MFDRVGFVTELRRGRASSAPNQYRRFRTAAACRGFLPTTLDRLMSFDGDPLRPMTPAQAADWLRLREFGYENPEQTLLEWVRLKKIECCHVGRKPAFTLENLRQYMSRELPRRGTLRAGRERRE